ncbi:MAG: RNA polymerase sigma-54 factor [bacterium ADurb.BinA186]|nr:MAG: RNA polymerase sigma-54 factor [bacterium ADurb.BinA186]
MRHGWLGFWAQQPDLDEFLLSLFSVSKDIKIYQANYRRARFLLKSLGYREQNLVRVAVAIVEYQRAWFFDNKELRPLGLVDIAQKTGLHESTVSRLVKNKGLASERGVHELKYFFSQRVSKAQEKSSSSVKDLIRDLIAKEDKTRPFSDFRLCQELGAQKVEIARRTVAKYREALGILPAHQRRVFSVAKPQKVE